MHDLQRHKIWNKKLWGILHVYSNVVLLPFYGVFAKKNKKNTLTDMPYNLLFRWFSAHFYLIKFNVFCR